MDHALDLAKEAHRFLVSGAGGLINQGAEPVECSTGIGEAAELLAGHGAHGQVDGEDSCSARGGLGAQAGDQLERLVRPAGAVESQGQGVQVFGVALGIDGH